MARNGAAPSLFFLHLTPLFVCSTIASVSLLSVKQQIVHHKKSGRKGNRHEIATTGGHSGRKREVKVQCIEKRER